MTPAPVPKPMEFFNSHPLWDFQHLPVVHPDGLRHLYIGKRYGEHLQGLGWDLQSLLMLISKPQRFVVVMSSNSTVDVHLAWVEFCRQVEEVG